MLAVQNEDIENFFKYQWFTIQLQESCNEWDSIIILPQYKLVVNVEVKSGLSFNALKKAATQTNKHLIIFRKIFGASLSREWKFVKAACNPNFAGTDDCQPCDYCKMFILKEVDAKNVEEWINSQTNPYISKSEKDYGREYESLLVGIIGFSSIRQSDKLILDPHEFNKDTARKLTAQDSAIQGENEKDRNKLREALESKQYTSEYLCYMLTPDQLMAVKDLSPYIIIEGNYGCGKTYVLKERAKLCAENYPESKIAYINLTIDDNNSKYVLNLMDIIAENNFEFYNNVNVVTAKHLIDHYFKNKDSLKDINRDFLGDGETCCLVLKHFLKQSNYDHVFIDEMPPFKEKVTVINDSFTSIKSFCITMRYDIYYNNINERWIKHMEKIANVKRLILKHNMRNTDTIDKLSTCFYENTREKENLLKADIIPNKNIIGPVCYHYHNIHDIDGDMLARAAIQKYFSNKKESVVVIYDPYISNAHTFCMYLLQNIK